jgi:hypothetical protein
MRFSSAIEKLEFSLETAPFADHFPVEVIWLPTYDCSANPSTTTNKRNIGSMARDYFLKGFTNWYPSNQPVTELLDGGVSGAGATPR